MYLVVIAWTYVVLMMAVAEASSTQGSVLGALVTFVLYGLIPISIVVYLMGTPHRRKALRAREAAQREQAQHAAHGQASDATPDASGHAATDAVASVREKP